MSMIRDIQEWLWGLIPDKCEITDCSRLGMYGNENIIFPFSHVPDFGVVACDYCHSKYERGMVLRCDKIREIITKETDHLYDIERARRAKRIRDSKRRNER